MRRLTRDIDLIRKRGVVMVKRLLGSKIMASREYKWLLCRTCKKATNKIHCRHSDTLRHIKEKRKTYNRITKYSDTRKTKYHNKVCRKKEIYYSYSLMDCIRKHHKLSVRKAPFSTKGVVVC